MVWRGERVLLIRRGKPPRAGQWSLPGGAQQLGETLAEAITREVREETGLELADLRLLTTVDLIEREPDGRVRYHYTLVDFTAEAADGEPVAGDDAAAVGWFALDELRRTRALVGDPADHRASAAALTRRSRRRRWSTARPARPLASTRARLQSASWCLRLPMLGEVAGELQQHALLRHHLGRFGLSRRSGSTSSKK